MIIIATVGERWAIRRRHSNLTQLERLKAMNKVVNLTGSSTIQPDRLSIALRAYVRPPPAKPRDLPPHKTRSNRPTPQSEWTVIEESIGRCAAILGRQGGDEFVILLPGIDRKEAVMIAKGLCEARALVQEHSASKFTISVGVGTEALGAVELGGLLMEADAALYRAKRVGGNQVASGSGRFVQPYSLPNLERFPTRPAKRFVPLQQGL
jgi:Diguanylate cyclase, GGDEF domain